MRNLEKFEKFMSKTDFGLDDITLVNDTYTRIGEAEIGAQTQATFGAGAIAGGVDFRRNIVIDLQTDAPADIDDCRVRLILTNAQETRRRLVAEELSQNIRAGVPLGEYLIKGLERDKLIIEVWNGTGADIDLDEGNSAISCPTTIYQ